MRTFLSIFFSFFSVLAFSIFSCLSIQAEESDNIDQYIENDSVTWDEFYYEVNKLHLKISIPNSLGIRFNDGNIYFEGFAEDYFYCIETSYYPNFNPHATQTDFLEWVQQINPNFLVVECPTKDLGAKYVVDLIPIHEGFVFARFLCTHNRIIKMETYDRQENRRQKFFDSIYIMN